MFPDRLKMYAVCGRMMPRYCRLHMAESDSNRADLNFFTDCVLIERLRPREAAAKYGTNGALYSRYKFRTEMENWQSIVTLKGKRNVP